jgi:hypothetical protein
VPAAAELPGGQVVLGVRRQARVGDEGDARVAVEELGQVLRGGEVLAQPQRQGDAAG